MLSRAGLVLPLLPIAVGAQISFGPPQQISDFVYIPDHVLSHDMDDDGDLDVIAAEGNSAPVRVLWWENDGTGNFGSRHEWTWGELESEVIAITDFNLDGRPDVWLQDRPYDTLDAEEMIQRRFLIALADGAGSFQPPTPLIDERVPSWILGEAIVADTNLDGRPDIVTPDAHYLATSTGTFAARIPMPESAAYLWHNRGAVTPTDLDDDGDLDLLAISLTTGFAAQVMWNPGTGVFPDPVPYVPLDQSATGRNVVPCTGSVRRRGRSLLVLTKQGSNETVQSSLALYRIAAGGSAQLVTSIDLAGTDAQTMRSWAGLSHDPASGRSFIGVVLNPRTLTDPTTELFEIVWSGDDLSLVPAVAHDGVIVYPPVVVRSLNGDPFPDLLVPIPDIGGTPNAAADQIVWHAGTTGGGFDESPHHVCQPAVDRVLYHAGDLDGDDAPDLLLGGYPPLWIPLGAHELSLYRNNGDGSSFERLPIAVGRKRIGVIEVKDITWPKIGGGNWPAGRMDVLVETYDYAGAASPGILRIEWLLQDESGGFHRTTLTTEASDGLVAPCYGDWDGDGTEDLVYRIEGGYGGPQLLWRRGTGGGFEAPRTLLTLVESVRGLVDIDWDGDLDLLLSGTLFGTLFGGEESYWCENDGSGTIVALRRLNRNLKPLGMDLDGDGHQDFTENGLVVFARAGVTFERPGNVQPAQYPSGLDLDDDGDLDLVYAAPIQGISGYSALGWWENRGSGVYYAPQDSPPMLPIAGAGWSIRDQRALADMDGDGSRDLVVVSSFAPRIEWFPITQTPAPAAFTDWIAGYGLSGHSAGPLFNFDNDRRSNWGEFAFGSHPGVPDPAHPGLPAILREGGTLSLSFLRRTDAATIGLDYTVMQSTDLLNWDPWSGTFEIAPEAGDYERVNFPLNSGEPRSFFTVDPTGPPSGP